MNTAFAAKTILSPALIGVASLISRRWGSSVGGWFAALPLTSGPVVLVLALQRGSVFAAEACIGTLLALISLAAFALVYSWSAASLQWPASCTLACAAYLFCTWTLLSFKAPLWIAFVVVCVVLAVTIQLMPTGAVQARAAPPPAWDVPARMALAVALVWMLTTVAGQFGPRLSGLLTPFPIAASILAGATHRLEGAASARRLLRSLLIGLFSFAVFFWVVGATITIWTVNLAFSLATLSALAVHAAIWAAVRSASPKGAQQ